MGNCLQNKVIKEEMEEIYSRYSPDFWQRFNGKSILISGSYGMLVSYFIYFFIYLNEVLGFKINIVTLSRNVDKLRNRFGEYTFKKYFNHITSSVCVPLSPVIDVDYIIHAASIAKPTLFTEIPVDVAATNMVGTYNLLELAVKKNVSGFLFFSTSSVYGSNNTGNKLLREDDYNGLDPLDIKSSYALSKAAGEMLIRAYFKQYGVRCKIVRIEHALTPMLTPVYGEQAILDFLKCALDGKPIKLTTSGQGIRSYVFGVDMVCAFAKILLDGENGEAYNLSNADEQIKLADVAQIIARIAGVELILPSGAAPQTVKHNILCNSKLRSLGWGCKQNVREGFTRLFDSVKQK